MEALEPGCSRPAWPCRGPQWAEVSRLPTALMRSALAPRLRRPEGAAVTLRRSNFQARMASLSCRLLTCALPAWHLCNLIGSSLLTAASLLSLWTYLSVTAHATAHTLPPPPGSLPWFPKQNGLLAARCSCVFRETYFIPLVQELLIYTPAFLPGLCFAELCGRYTWPRTWPTQGAREMSPSE